MPGRGDTDGTLIHLEIDYFAFESPLVLPVDAPFRVPIMPDTWTELRAGTLALPQYCLHLRRAEGG